MLTKNTLYLRITKKPRWHKEKFKTAHPASNIILILLGKKMAIFVQGFHTYIN